MDLITVYPPGASLLASYGASAINLGSWLNAEAGMDFGTRDLINSQNSANALTDGGRFAFRNAPPRKWAIPLIINQPGTTTPQAAVRLWESALARALTPGAMLSIQPEGVPTAQAVFFDVIDGRWEPDYSIFEQRANVRKGFVRLTTQPFGYWPTEILLASAASVGYLGALTVNGAASLLGDVPPLVHLQIAPTVASIYPAGTWLTDMVAFSFGARASFNALQTAVSFQTLGGVSSTTGDKYAPASQAYTITASNAAAFNPTWTQMFTGGFASALEPAYRGRFRVFMFARTTPSTAPWQAIVDADRMAGGVGNGPALASSNPIATVYNVIPSANSVGTFISASPAYSIFDMGEISLPPVASGVQSDSRLRVWLQNPSVPAGSGFQFLFGGLYLLPVDAAAGIQVRGLAAPSVNGYPAPIPTFSTIEWNRNFIDSVLLNQLNVSGVLQLSDARSNFRGVSPRMGASTTQVIIFLGDRAIGTGAPTYPIVQSALEYAQVSVSYRPTFQFLAGV